MPTIAGFTVTVMKGRMPPFNWDYRRVTRTGVAGHGIVYDAARCPENVVTTGVETDASQLATLIQSYLRQRMTTVEIEDQFAVRYTDVLVLTIEYRYWPMISGPNWWLEADWRLQRLPPTSAESSEQGAP